jgi:hypothetical protein
MTRQPTGEEVRALAEWGQENKLSLNVNKTKELIMDFRKQQRENAPVHIDGSAVEKVESFKFLGVHVTDNLKLSTHTDNVAKAAQKYLFNLRRLQKFSLAPMTLRNLHQCQIESILPGNITACTATAPAATAGLSRGGYGLPNASPGTHCLPFRSSSTRCHRKADQQGPKPPPVHPAIIQKARSVKVHQSRDRETEKQLLSQGHNVK